MFAGARQRATAGMTRRELGAEGLVIAGFALSVAILWWLKPPHGLPSTAALWSLLVLVLATRVSFETPFGFTVATQLAFVPLVFALSPALVPVAVLAAFMASSLPDILMGRRPAAKLLRAPANAWFAVGPAFVFAISGTPPGRASGGLLLIALAAQFIGDFVVSAAFFRLTDRTDLRWQIRDCWVYVIDAALSGVGLVVAAQMRQTPFAVLAVLPLLGLLAMFAHERNRRLAGLLELNDTYKGTALLLGDVISADDGYTGEHSVGVVGLALELGDRLGLDTQRRRNLEFAALLHDVGKIAIPKEIINKPGKLDADEWELMKTHTTKGQAMLERVGGFMLEVGLIVRSHHERWDGQGYPDGLRGAQIPLEARIISCCDAWSAMRTDRAYRAALPQATAVAQLVENAGTQFDPELTAALLAMVEPEPEVDTPAAETDPEAEDRVLGALPRPSSPPAAEASAVSDAPRRSQPTRPSALA